jgi:hypothetical protein
VRDPLVAFGVAVVAGWLWIAVRTPAFNTDVGQYAKITRGVQPYHQFGARILTPVLARVVPIESITVVGVGVAAAALVAFLQPIVGSWKWVGVGVFLTGPALIAWEQPRRVDGLLFAAVAATFWLLERRRWGWLGIVLALGVANHELLLVALPAVAVVGWREREWRAVWPVAAGVCTYLLLTRTNLVWGRPLGPAGRPIDASFFRLMAWEPVAIRAGGSVPRALARELLVGLGAGSALAVAGWRLMPRWLRDCAVMAPVALALWLVASDWYRTVTPLFPLVSCAACFGARAAWAWHLRMNRTHPEPVGVGRG